MDGDLQQLSPAAQAQMFRHAAVLFGLGLVFGLIFTFEVIGHVAIWPLVPEWAFDVPGEEAAWRRTHLGALMNALAVMGFAAAGPVLQLGARARRWYVVMVLVTAWGNTLGFLTGALFGVRGLAFGGDWANSLNYLFFLVAALTAFVQCGLLWRGARVLHRAPA
jgi:hypothetical protein